MKVVITPEVSSRKTRKAIIGELVKVHGNTELEKRLPANDGEKNLYTSGRLPFTQKVFDILLSEEDETTCSTRERKFEVQIKFAAQVSMHQLHELLSGKKVDTPQEALNIIDIVLKEFASHSYVSFGRLSYSPDLRKSHTLSGGLESWRGFYQSIKATQMGLSLNVDMSSTAFIESLPVIDYVAQILGKDVHLKPLSDADRVKIKRALRGVKVEITYRGSVRRKYKITGLTSQPTRELIFPLDKEMKMQSVIDYFQEKYEYTIMYPHLPCPQVGSQEKLNYLPMEVCKIVGGHRYSKGLNEKQITSLLKVSCQRPRGREDDILQTIHQNDYNCNPYAKEFGISVDNKLASVEARVLPAPWLKYHDTGRENKILPQIGQWNMMNKEFSTEPVIPVYSARPDMVKKALGHVHFVSRNKLGGKELELLIAILPDKNGSLYAHPDSGEDVCPSTAAVVASQDWPEVSKYAGLVCAQTPREELIKDLFKCSNDPQHGIVYGGMIRRQQEKKTHRIIFYRDGVGDGQFYQVLLYKLDAIRKGTSRAAHYHVIWDDNNFSADEIQSLTNNLCYTYARCTRSVSVVPPVYYAHLAAYRARFYMEPDVHENAKSHATRSNIESVRPLPALKENVKNVMFNC
ncbi:hypothetical protein KIW84_041436 [Lathyrus oleraceus]|uniref:Protein argonaute PNH1 n=1 Tax=Pisum sativum TaxID=3888 RepID=A0A9D4X9V2_PEA|nr:hypothetical protein KIW84_041436 [Pisum sativum]